MKISQEEYAKASHIAEEIMKMSRNSIMVKMRFLDVALFNLEPEQVEGTYATDGKKLYYDVEHLLSRYVKDSTQIPHDIMHILLHCIFRHFFVNPYAINQHVWNLACDVAVESMIEDFNLGKKSNVNSSEHSARLNLINDVRSNVKDMTAEKIYRFYLAKGFTDEQIDDLRNPLIVDNHAIWYVIPEKKVTIQIDGNGNGQSSDAEGGSSNGQSLETDEGGGVSANRQSQDAYTSGGNGNGGIGGSLSIQQLAEEWEAISRRVQVDMETASFGKTQGIGAGGMLQNLQSLNREKYDYTTFLKKFSVMGEAMKVNDDEFDYIFYTYGLKKYGNMPLIEPLEYKEVKRIREFVIAIDTSGSVSGELVQKFLQKTYNILKQADTFFTKFNLHIIQCDAVIQDATKITDQEEFDRYIENLKLKGFGGTDFRPVFKYVNAMIKNHEFSNLKGMIYFTDGYGTFPEKKPNYNTAFVFLRNYYDIPKVPPWAIKLVLENEEI